MTFPFGTGSVGGDLYAQGIGIALGQSRLYDPDYALRQDPEAYEKVRRDAVVAFVLRQRKLLGAGVDWRLEPASSAAADVRAAAIVEGLLRRCRRFTLARYNLLEAIYAGSRWAELVVEPQEVAVAGLPPRRWFVVGELRDADKRRFRLVPLRQDGQPVRPTDELPAAAYRWEVHRPRHRPEWQPIDPRAWVHHVHDDREDALAQGSGLLAELYNYWWAKAEVLQRGLQFVDRWAQGLVVAGIDASAGDIKSAQARAADLLTALEKTRTEHFLAYHKPDEVQVLQPPTAGWGAAKEALDYLDQGITRLVLGAVLPTGGGGQGEGSFARARVEADSTYQIVQHDRALLEETLTRDVVGCLWRLNHDGLRELGLEGVAPPSLRIRDEERSDPKDRAAVLVAALGAGVPVRRDELYAQLGLTPPAAGEAVVEPRPAPAPAGQIFLA